MFLYATATNAAGTQSYTVLLSAVPKDTVVNLGTFDLAGTLAGAFTSDSGGDGNINNPIGGNVNVIDVGYLYGDVRIGGNLGDFISRTGDYQKNACYIEAGGAIGMVDERPNSTTTPLNFSVSVLAEDNGGLESGQTTVSNLESLNLLGYMGAYAYKDNTYQTAQYLSCPSAWGSTLTVNGWLNNNPKSTAGPVDTQDWYAIPLMAGQTVSINGQITTDGEDLPLLGSEIQAYLYNPAIAYNTTSTNMEDTLGFITQEDAGIGSVGADQQPLTFTAPTAGIYYLKVLWNSTDVDSQNYQLTITGGPTAYLGGVNIAGNFIGQALPLAYDSAGDSILATNGGGIGGISTWAEATGETGILAATIRSAGHGNLVAVQAAASLGENTATEDYPVDIVSESNIGMIQTNYGDFYGWAYAGDAEVNPNADLQNMEINGSIDTDPDYTMSISSPMSPTIAASGSIGVITVTGNVLGVKISANYTGQATPPFYIDMIQVGGNWGDMTAGVVPILTHGPGGDVGYITVAGTIYQYFGSYVNVATVDTFSDGQARSVQDDGGGELTITPQATTLLSSTGQPVVDTTTTGLFKGKVEKYLPTYSYVEIGVDDDGYAGMGTGGVIANLTATGNIDLSSSGHVDISDINVSSASATATTCELVDGATGNGSTMNGVYAPTGQTVNGQPVYTDGNNTLEYDGTNWDLYKGSTLRRTSAPRPPWFPSRTATPLRWSMERRHWRPPRPAGPRPASTSRSTEKVRFTPTT